MGILKMLALLIAALGMAAVESGRAKDEDDVALFVGSARPLAAKRPITGPSNRDFVAPRSGLS